MTGETWSFQDCHLPRVGIAHGTTFLTRPPSPEEPPVHVPDGFLDAPTSVATGVAAAAVVGVALRGARRELDDRTAPLTGLVAAFVFAVQMLNFPVGAGTSGHLLGGALAAVLVGPWTAVLCLTVVLAVQALFFADGGITALGTNITLMGVVTVIAGWAVFALVLRLLPKRPASTAPAAFVAALVSVPASALCFVWLYVVGGTAEISLAALMTAMLGWHVLIGIGEAVITAATVASIVAVRPDLVYGARGLLGGQSLVIRSTPVTSKEAAS
jgi:cobalt/nickel transport system permease protein